MVEVKFSGIVMERFDGKKGTYITYVGEFGQIKLTHPDNPPVKMGDTVDVEAMCTARQSFQYGLNLTVVHAKISKKGGDNKS